MFVETPKFPVKNRSYDSTFTFPMHGREYYLEGQIFRMEILMDLPILRSLERKTHI